MVVDHDDVDAPFGQEPDLFRRGRPAVDRHPQGHLEAFEAVLDPGGAEPVALLHAVGQVVVDGPAQAPESRLEEGGGRDAIDIVVPEDEHGLPAGPRLHQAGDCPVHVREIEGVGEQPEARLEEQPGRLRVGEVPLDEAPGQEGIDPEVFTQASTGLRVRLGDRPAAPHAMSSPSRRIRGSEYWRQRWRRRADWM